MGGLSWRLLRQEGFLHPRVPSRFGAGYGAGSPQSRTYPAKEVTGEGFWMTGPSSRRPLNRGQSRSGLGTNIKLFGGRGSAEIIMSQSWSQLYMLYGGIKFTQAHS